MWWGMMVGWGEGCGEGGGVGRGGGGGLGGGEGFFFNDTATTEFYTLSLHDALPISSSLKSEVKVRRWM